MTHNVYKYYFNESIPFQEVEDTFALAFLAVECLHGKSRARLDIGFNVNKTSRTCMIDVYTKAGRDLDRIFYGFAAVEYGESAIQIERACSAAGLAACATGPRGANCATGPR